MKVILSGGGSGERPAELDKRFAQFLDKNRPLLYIPIAIDTEKHPYPGCLEWLKSTFDNLGVEKYDMITEKDLEDYSNKNPEQFSGIYIGGGNTPYLLKTLKETKIWEFLKKAIEQDIPIYGGSAGAIIFAKSIIPSLYHDENNVGLNDFSGMNILKEKEITCHYVPEEKESVLEMIKKHNMNEVIALTERNGLLIANERTILIGQEPALIFNNNKIEKIEVGDEIK